MPLLSISATPGSVPRFQLADGRGGTAGTEDVLQRQEVVLALLHPVGCSACDATREALARAAGELAARKAKALIVVMPPYLSPGGSAAPAALRPAELLDTDGQVARALTAALGASAPAAWLVVADRFGSIYTATPLHEAAAGAAVADAVEWVDFIQMQCPECGAPEW